MIRICFIHTQVQRTLYIPTRDQKIFSCFQKSYRSVQFRFDEFCKKLVLNALIVKIVDFSIEF